MSIPATREWVDAKISKSIRAAVGEGGDKPPKALSEMTDVVVASPSNNQALMWDSTSSMWMNKNIPAGTKNYNDLTNKPSINGTELVGNIVIPTGGTEVEGNPEGTATEDLKKIKIGEKIFSIPEGGGSESRLVSFGSTTTAYDNAKQKFSVGYEDDDYICYDVGTNDFVCKKSGKYKISVTYGISSSSSNLSKLSFRINDEIIDTIEYTTTSTSFSETRVYELELNVDDRVCVFKDTGAGWGYCPKIIFKIADGSSSSTHEYSTEEKVVGKWIDGSDVYEIVSKEKPKGSVIINNRLANDGYHIYEYFYIDMYLDLVFSDEGTSTTSVDEIIPVPEKLYLVGTQLKNGVRLYECGCVINLGENTITPFSSEEDEYIYNYFKDAYWEDKDTSINLSACTYKYNGNDSYTFYWKNTTSNYGTINFNVADGKYNMNNSYKDNSSFLFNYIKNE